MLSSLAILLFVHHLNKELKIAERFAAYNATDIDKVSRIDERDEQRRIWESYHRSVRKYDAGISEASFSKGNSST